jgi:c-di-GMP-binding flagellar brake protein YcgR
MKLPLEVKDAIQVRENNPGPQIFFDSRVEEITAGELLISWPVKGARRMPVREQQTVAVVFSRDQRIYEFEASVLDVISDPAPLVAVQPLGALRSIQRRDDYRIRVLAGVELAPKVVRLAGFKQINTRSHHIQCHTVNLSAGGFSIRHSSPLVVGASFEVKLALPSEIRQPLQLSARVVRCAPAEVLEGEAAAFDVGFAFTRISEPARQQIVRFVFGVQREEHTKE